MYTNEQTEPDRLDKLLAAVFEELVTVLNSISSFLLFLSTNSSRTPRNFSRIYFLELTIYLVA